jgi:hypothetical protein
VTASPTERSRGIADVTLSPTGKSDVDKLGRDLARIDTVDVIYTSPLWRCLQTAKSIARYSGSRIAIVPSLMTWSYGANEGRPSKYTEKVLLKYAQRQPQTPVPGVGPVSGLPGDSFDNWKNGFLRHGLFPILRSIERFPELVIAIVLHSRDIYVFDGWIRAGQPRSLSIDFHDMIHEEHKPGEVALASKGPGGLWDTSWVDPEDPKTTPEDLGRHKPAGLLIRHGSTWWNEGV